MKKTARDWWIQIASLFALVAVLAAWVVLPFVGALALLALLTVLLLVTRRGRQALAVTGVGLRTLGRRMGAAAVVVVGVAGVVGVLVALLAMAEGYSETLRKTGDAQTAIVMRGGSASEVMSVLDRDSMVQIMQSAGIAKTADGTPIASSDLVVAANLPLKGKSDDEGSVQLRGVDGNVWLVRPQVRIVEGRRFKPGLREVIVGSGVARQFANMQPGREIRLGTHTWTVAGVFASGDALDSEVWADVNMVADTYRRGGSRTSMTARLESPDALPTLKASLDGNAQLKVSAITTEEYFTKQSEGATRVLRVIGISVGIVMAIGAAFGVLNTMFAAVAARMREIATLRAIGFAGLPVVVSVMLETMALAAIGGCLGGALAWAIFNGYSASTLASGSVGQLSFALHVTPGLLWTGLKWALAIGLVGGLYPALQAARMPVAHALREL